MTVDLINENGRCRVRIEDELTVYTASMISESIRDALADHEVVAIDLAGVSEIDTAGLQMLLVAKKEAALRNREVSFIGHNNVVMECLRLVNLASFFKFEAAAAQAA